MCDYLRKELPEWMNRDAGQYVRNGLDYGEDAFASDPELYEAEQDGQGMGAHLNAILTT